MCKKCKAKMNGRRRKKRSSVGALSLKDPVLTSAIYAGAGIVAGQFLGSKLGKMLAPKEDVVRDGKTILKAGQVRGLISGAIQLAGGIAVRQFLPSQTALANGMISSGIVSAAKDFIPALDFEKSVAGIPYGSTYNPGVAGPDGSLYLPGVAGPGSVMIE